MGFSTCIFLFCEFSFRKKRGIKGIKRFSVHFTVQTPLQIVFLAIPCPLVLLFSFSLSVSHLFLSHPPFPRQSGGEGVDCLPDHARSVPKCQWIACRDFAAHQLWMNGYRKSLSGLLCLDHCKTQAEKWMQNFSIFAVLHYRVLCGCKTLAEKWLQNFSIFAVLHYAMVTKPRQKNYSKILPFLQSCTTL